MSDSANFRGIALSSVFGEVFNNIILERYHQKLSSCDMQFGFKPKSSKNMCSVMLKEVISYYIQHQSHAFCTFLDATEAYDRIKYCKLFNTTQFNDTYQLLFFGLLLIYTQIISYVFLGVVRCPTVL